MKLQESLKGIINEIASLDSIINVGAYKALNIIPFICSILGWIVLISF